MTTPTLTTQQIAAMPRVNLLPREIDENRRARKTKALLGAGVAGSVVVVGALYMLAHGGVSSAQSDLDAARTQQATLQSQVATYQHDVELRNQRDSRAEMLTQAMGPEIQWSHYLNDLTLRTPDNSWLLTLEATENVDTPTAATTDDVLADSGLGNIHFTGVALAHDDVAAWLNSMSRQKGFVNPYFTSSVEGYIDSHKVFNFDSTVSLSPKALSGRYTKPAGS